MTPTRSTERVRTSPITDQPIESTGTIQNTQPETVITTTTIQSTDTTGTVQSTSTIIQTMETTTVQNEINGPWASRTRCQNDKSEKDQTTPTVLLIFAIILLLTGLALTLLTIVLRRKTHRPVDNGNTAPVVVYSASSTPQGNYSENTNGQADPSATVQNPTYFGHPGLVRT